jgi:Invasion associated locus B (IalB) protein
MTAPWRIMNRRFLIAALAALLAPSAAALAQQDVGTFQYWTTFTQDDPDGKMCFIASQPQDKKYSQPIQGRDPVFFMVTSIPAKGIRNEVSTIIGYPFAPGQDVTVDVDGTKFKMFTSDTQGDTAWAVADQQAALVDAMKAGHTMSVAGQSKRGTVTTDIYSLRGVTDALNKAASECP